MSKNDKITIGLSTSSHPVSKLIEFAGRSKVSHAFLSYQDEKINIPTIFHSNHWGVHRQTKKSFLKKNIILAEYIVSHSRALSAARQLGRHLDSGYDYGGMFIAGWYTLFRKWFGIRMERREGCTVNAMMCSETIAWYLRYLDLDMFRNISPEAFAPWDLLDLMRDNKIFVKIIDEA